MSSDFILQFHVKQTPQQAFAAINDVRSWWSGEVEGDPGELGAEFSYRVPGVHFSRQKVVESVPGEKIVWRVTEARLDFVAHKEEWNGSDLIFELARKGDETELTFTHRGLTRALDCFEDCSNAWGSLINGNLRRRIATGEPQPSPW